MALEVNNIGNGFIGEISDGWSITQNGSPAIVGQSAGRLGSLSFDAGCDDTTPFTIDDYLSVKHYFDDDNRWMSTFDGYIRGVTVRPGFASFSMNSLLSSLDVERQTSANVSGVYQRTMTLTPTAYTIAGTPYVTPENPVIYDMSSTTDDYFFVLAQGGHSGEVVFVMDVSGRVSEVWPVYSDATDLANPMSRIISYTNATVWIGQTGAKRVKSFLAHGGAFQSQWGSAGSADGQFQSIDGIAMNGTYNSIFVSDSVLGRIQRFNFSGVYQNKWGILPVSSTFANPSVEVDLTGISAFTGSGTISLTRGSSAGFTYWGVGYARAQFTVATATPTGQIFNRANVVAGQTYDFSARARITGANQQMQLVVIWKNQAGASLGSDNGVVTTITSSGWGVLRLTSPIIAPAGAVTADVVANTAASGRAWLINEVLAVDGWADGPGVNRITVTSTGDHVFASNYGGVIEEYDSFGNLQSVPFGSYDLTTNIPTGEFFTGASIKLEFDSHGSAYAIQNGTIFKYVNTGLGSFGNWPAGLNAVEPNQQWQTGTTGVAMCILSSGIMHVGSAARTVEQYSASAGSLQAYLLYIIGLAAPDFPVRLLALNEPFPLPEYIAWRGNVWAQLCDLMAVTNNSMYAFDDGLYFSDRTGDTFQLPDDTAVIPVEIDSRASGRSIQITSQNTSRITGADAVVYDAQADNNRTFSVGVNDLTYVTVSQNTYPEHIFPLVPATAYPVAQGQYLVTDANGLTVTPALWTNYGGSVRAEGGENPGDILITITGPGLEIPGFESPYKIASISGQAALKINGVGVRANPEVLSIGTGVSEEIANQDVAQRIESFAVADTATAYSSGVWSAYSSGTPTQRVTITMRLDKTLPYKNDSTGINGIATLLGDVVRVRDALYIIEDLTYNQGSFTLGCYRYTETGVPEAAATSDPRFEEIWGGRSAGEFDAYWAGHSAQDFTIAPLRNPYGV